MATAALPRLRILLVGASGTLGRAVAAELSERHEIVSAGRNSGDVRIDISNPSSIAAGLGGAGQLDAVVCCAGHVTFAPLSQINPATITESAYSLGLTDKLMGQVNLTLVARDRLRDGGSITLIGGILSEQPIVAGTSASMVNGALESFVKAVAVELPRGIRINLVSPTVLTESMPQYAPFFRGFAPVPAARAALGFARSVEGPETGQVYRIFG